MLAVFVPGCKSKVFIRNGKECLSFIAAPRT